MAESDLSLEPQADAEAKPGRRAGGELSQSPRAVADRKRRAARKGSGGQSRRTPRAANPLGDSAPAGRPSRASKANADSLAAITGMLMMANAGVAMVAPEDVLAEDEIAALATALLNDPWTGGPLTKVKAFTHAPLIMTAVAIAVPRLVRHNLVPGGIFEGSATPPADEPSPFAFERPPVPEFVEPNGYAPAPGPVPAY